MPIFTADEMNLRKNLDTTKEHNESERLRKEIEDLFIKITVQMKKELQRGYYDEA